MNKLAYMLGKQAAETSYSILDSLTNDSGAALGLGAGSIIGAAIPAETRRRRAINALIGAGIGVTTGANVGSSLYHANSPYTDDDVGFYRGKAVEDSLIGSGLLATLLGGNLALRGTSKKKKNKDDE